MGQLFAKSGPDWTTLYDHTFQVANAASRFARHLNLDEVIARNGAILHDLGKAHPVFQHKLKGKNSKAIFRHEIASLFFLPLFKEEIHSQLIEMVVGHHKSVVYDLKRHGLLDLIENDDIEEYHLGIWESWSESAIRVATDLGVPPKKISREEALCSFQSAINYCSTLTSKRGYSTWRGLLMAADHFASALISDTDKNLQRTFRKPNLVFFDRRNEAYPLSLKSAVSEKPHTIVVACTGAGKTDFLLRRCKNRVFYCLPFQASINAMYRRLARDLEGDNPDLDIRVLHAASTLIRLGNEEEETVLQPLFGSAVKVLTPHQLAAIVFGIKGYEAILLDLQDEDVILDEIHTYTGVSQSIVLKLVSILTKLKCRIHIGTATMPSVLYRRIIDILGKEQVLEVKLEPKELDSYDRHIVYKLNDFDDSWDIIDDAVANCRKVLIVCNVVERAQHLFQKIEDRFPEVESLLLHSRFRRSDRNAKEQQLLGLDKNGNPLGTFNTSRSSCIVVATQIVEVSLDISFDVMITECAPLDALIQRFGRINRKRTVPRELRSVYVIAPKDTAADARPYKLEVLLRTFDVLPHGEKLRERDLQEKIDMVFPEMDFLDIETHSHFKNDGDFSLGILTHKSKSYLLDILEIDSAMCITESDREAYMMASYEERMQMEIPMRYWLVKELDQIKKKGNRPFIVPDVAYSVDLGLDRQKLTSEYYNSTYQII